MVSFRLENIYRQKRGKTSVWSDPEDPRLFRRYKATKEMDQGNISFDDRAYVKLKVKEEVRG
jgi:hypothetical protein